MPRIFSSPSQHCQHSYLEFYFIFHGVHLELSDNDEIVSYIVDASTPIATQGKIVTLIAPTLVMKKAQRFSATSSSRLPSLS